MVNSTRRRRRRRDNGEIAYRDTNEVHSEKKVVSSNYGDKLMLMKSTNAGGR